MTANEKKPTQRTPEGTERERLGLDGEGGTEIPIPTRKRVYEDLAKVAKPRRERQEDSRERE